MTELFLRPLPSLQRIFRSAKGRVEIATRLQLKIFQKQVSSESFLSWSPEFFYVLAHVKSDFITYTRLKRKA